MENNKGFVIMAQGDSYVKCAQALELSIKQVMPNANVTIITTEMLPHGDQCPDIFKKSQLAQQFFETTRTIWENWKEVRDTLQCNVNELATTDWVYAIASHIIGVEKTTLPQFEPMTMIHMKQHINNTPSEDWTDIFTTEILPHTIRVNTIPQLYPFHYHVKHFANTILENLK
jgi:hypothetical protein